MRHRRKIAPKRRIAARSAQGTPVRWRNPKVQLAVSRFTQLSTIAWSSSKQRAFALTLVRSRGVMAKQGAIRSWDDEAARWSHRSWHASVPGPCSNPVALTLSGGGFEEAPLRPVSVENPPGTTTHSVATTHAGRGAHPYVNGDIHTELHQPRTEVCHHCTKAVTRPICRPKQGILSPPG